MVKEILAGLGNESCSEEARSPHPPQTKTQTASKLVRLAMVLKVYRTAKQALFRQLLGARL